MNAAQRRLRIATAALPVRGGATAKAHLLTTLCGNENGKLEICRRGPYYDYFTSIPGHAPAMQAIRFFTRHFFKREQPPLRQVSISEADRCRPTLRTSFVPRSVAVSKNPLSHHAENGNVLPTAARPGVTAEEVATIASFLALCSPSARQHIEMTWQHFASLLPALDLTTRAHARALPWGATGKITQQWLALAHMLATNRHAGELAAPSACWSIILLYRRKTS